MKYAEYPESERPENRLREVGTSSLSMSELLSVALFITDSDTARDVTKLVEDSGGLGKVTRAELTRIKGIGDRYADAVLAIVELTRREKNRPSNERMTFHSPQDIYDEIGYSMAILDHEELWITIMDTRNRLVKIEKLYRGSLNSSQVRIGEVFNEAIRIKCASIAIVHNHPSGDPTPSPEDVALTRAVVSAGKLLDIDVLDHLVIGQGKFVSLKERGLGFN